MPCCHVTLSANRPKDRSYPAELNTIGDHLRKRRLDLGHLQREVADRIGVTACTIMYWETGRAFPAIRHIPKIITFLGYSPFNEPKTLAERLVQRRKLLGLSRKQAAKHLGTDPSNLAGWETCLHKPTKKSLQLISDFLLWTSNIQR